MTTISFAGRNIKWNNAEDAQVIKKEILATKDLTCLILEGNTLGIEAAKEIGEALASQPKFERAHWKDLFTGRLKNEIPQALKHLFSGVNKSGAKLKELDLSDNALGPLGVEGITDFLTTDSCYSLEELRLNNNGLGIKGGTMLANALLELAKNAKSAGSPLGLKVFIGGRNRLEKEGAAEFAKVFSEIKTLEEIVMPQNGIFHKGIAALAKAFSINPNLKIINLNDNTFTYQGAKAMAEYLPAMQNLEVINFGDCLIKTEGALSIASAIKDGHNKLRTLHLDSNEIKVEGAFAILDAVMKKDSMESLMLDANQFGEHGCLEIKRRLKEHNKESILGELEDDEEPDDDESEEEEEFEVISHDESSIIGDEMNETIEFSKCTAKEFVDAPTASHLLGLDSSGSASASLIDEARIRANTFIGLNYEMNIEEAFIHECITILMKTASLLNNDNNKVKNLAGEYVKELAKNAFETAQKNNLESLVPNTLLVHFGLMKSENKSFKISWDLKGGLVALAEIAKEDFFPKDAKNTLQFFFSKPAPLLDPYFKEKHKVMQSLFAC